MTSNRKKIAKPAREEINSHTIKLIIGVVAISLAALTSFFAKMPLESISASYYEGGWSQAIFIGFLFAIAAFLIAYNGQSTFEMSISKIAGIAAICVAMFPCDCGKNAEVVPYIHFAAAAVMFVILAVFCYIFLDRARKKPSPESTWRAYIYAACGLTILLSIAVMVGDMLSHGAIIAKIPRLIFYGEATGLVAFGIAWLTASRTIPLITGKSERYSLSPFEDADAR